MYLLSCNFKENGEYWRISETTSLKRGEKQKLLITISCNKKKQSFLNDKERRQIETCFRAMQSSGFGMENTCLKDLSGAISQGFYIGQNAKATIIKKHGHRAKSALK